MAINLSIRTTLLFLIILLFLFQLQAIATTRTSIGAGNWTNTAVWSGGVLPAAGDTVVINTNVTVNGSTANINRIIINSGFTLAFSTAGATKVLTIAAGGSIINNGSIDMTGGNGDINVGAGAFFTMGAASTLIWQPASNTVGGATLFTNTTETINSTSLIRLNSWYDTTIPFKQVVSGNLGNITFNYGAGTWDQKGTLAPAVVQGTLTMSATGQLILDGGTGMTTSLTLKDVNVTAGTLIFAQGANRNLTLVTNNLTVATGTTLVSMMYQTYGILNMTVNGNMTVNEDFTLIQGPSAGALVNSSSTISVTGNLAIGGGLFDLHRGLLNGNCTLSVAGGLSITGTPLWVRFMDMDCVGNLAVNAGSFTVSGGGSNFLFLEDATTNTATYNITGNMSVSGASTLLYLMGGDDGGFPLAAVSDPRGNLSLTVGGTYSQSGGTFRGIHNNVTYNAGTYTFNYGAINFTGGVYLAHYACSPSAVPGTVNVTGDASFSFAATTDQVWFNALGLLGTDPSSLLFNMTVGGNMTIAGAAGSWRSSNATGAETITIGGNVTISGGVNSFNLATASGLTNYHNVTGTIGGDLAVSGGTTHLSAKDGTATSWTINGNVSVTGGVIGVKGGTGAATVNILGGYSQTAGSFFLHNASTAVTANVIAVTVNSNNDGTGDFSHTGGTINFDDCATAGAATHTLTIYSPNYTVGGAAATSITRAGAGTGALFGEIHFARAAGTAYNRSTTNHNVQQVKQLIDAGALVVASASTNPFQIASNSTQNNAAGTAAVWPLTVNGTLTMGSTIISGQGPSLTGYYSGVKVNSGGLLRTANVNGFYNGTNGSATVEPQVFSGNTSYRMDFSLDANCTIEYNATANQVVTGKHPNAGALADVQSATTAQYKYGILDINNLGTIGTNYANPAVSGTGTGNVFVRTNLKLTRGEFNLAGSGTGQTVVVENAATAGITRDGATTVGYIKSEETNGGNNRAIVQWNIGATTGAHIYPFGLYASGAIQYIPVTVNNSGNIGNFSVSTRSTPSANTTWAAASNGGAVGAVSQMYDPTLTMDGSVPAVIDRWWDFTSSLNMTAPCTTAVASTAITFSYRGAENTMSAPYNTGFIGAQHWGFNSGIANTFGWESQIQPSVATAAVTAGIGSVTIPGLTNFSPYILSAVAAPLPIKLLSFDAECNGSGAKLNWTTASEHNNDFFTIEKSIDGKSFSQVTRIKGAGDSHTRIEYSYTDETRNAKQVFYRLKQTDFNGTVSYSDVIVLGCSSKQGLSIESYINGSSDVALNLQSGYEEDITGEIALLDVTGKLVSHIPVLINTGSSIVHINCPTSAGTYFVQIIAGGEVFTKRIYRNN